MAWSIFFKIKAELCIDKKSGLLALEILMARMLYSKTRIL